MEKKDMGKRDWIDAFGSDRLKLGISMGYPMDELYTEEFIKTELNKNGEWKFGERDFYDLDIINSPSLEELKMQEKAIKEFSSLSPEISIVEGTEILGHGVFSPVKHYLRLYHRLMDNPVYAELGGNDE